MINIILNDFHIHNKENDLLKFEGKINFVKISTYNRNMKGHFTLLLQ